MNYVEINGVSFFLSSDVLYKCEKQTTLLEWISAVLQKLSLPPTKDSKSLISGRKQSWIKPSEAVVFFFFPETQWQLNSIL